MSWSLFGTLLAQVTIFLLVTSLSLSVFIHMVVGAFRSADRDRELLRKAVTPERRFPYREEGR